MCGTPKEAVQQLISELYLQTSIVLLNLNQIIVKKGCLRPSKALRTNVYRNNPAPEERKSLLFY